MAVDFMDRRTVQRGDFYALTLWTMIVQFLLILPLIGLVKPMPLVAYIICAAVGGFSAFSRVSWYRAISAHGQTLSRISDPKCFRNERFLSISLYLESLP